MRTVGIVFVAAVALREACASDRNGRTALAPLISNDFVFGLDLFSDTPGSWSSPDGQLAVQQVATRMDARTIAIVPSWFQWSLNSTSIEADPHKSITDDDVRAAA